MTTDERKKEISEAIKNLKTVVSFVNDHNKNTADGCAEMINMLNRFLKSKLAYSTAVLSNGDEKAMNANSHNQMWEMKHLINALTK